MQKVIEVQQLKFSYGKHPVLKQIDFEVQKGCIVGLIGVNGAGKTTLLNVLLGLLKAPGEVQVNGQMPGTSRQVGSMLQGDLKLIGVTVLDILKEVAGQYQNAQDPQQLLDELDLSDLAKKRLNSLSGGQLRRVTFAMALVGNPNLIFLDEPTVGMDVNARQHFWEKIYQLKKTGKTIFITSHYLEEIQKVADQLLILKDGRIAFDGTLNELQQRYLTTQITFQTSLESSAFQNVAQVQKITKQDETITLSSTDGDATLKDLVPLLNQLRHVNVIDASLESIFMTMTQGEK